ncbi:MAG: hypothetical protein WAU48_11010 [Gammaproteobacteria bacterium]
MQLRAINAPHDDAGFVRQWRAGPGSLADRMVHFRLCAGPVDTQLFFLFGRAGSVMPHLHVQVVQFSAEACVFNADFLPRLDPVDFPDYFRQVFSPLNMPYWKAINDYQNMCSHAPGNPAIATYLSHWSIGTSRPATASELAKVSPSIHAYLAHWLKLANTLRFAGPDAEVLRRRDTKHLNCFLDESLDPRAWKGVYNVVGKETGQQIRQAIAVPLH